MRARRYTVIVADRSIGIGAPIHAQPAPGHRSSVCAAGCPADPDGSWREVESAVRHRSAAQPPTTALEVENASYRTATGELTSQIQSLEGVVDDLGSRATLDPAAARTRCGSFRPRSVKRARRRPDGGQHAVERAVDLTHLSRRHVRRAARPAAGARKPAELRAPRRRAARGAGQRDAVDLADPRRADRLLRRPQRSIHRRARLSPGHRHFDRKGPADAAPPPTASSRRRPTRATTATSSS